MRAKRDGTYPQPGETYGIYRTAGAVFTLNDNDDFAGGPHGWMEEVGAEEVPVAPVRQVPQTTSRVAGKANPFPPMV